MTNLGLYYSRPNPRKSSTNQTQLQFWNTIGLWFCSLDAHYISQNKNTPVESQDRFGLRIVVVPFSMPWSLKAHAVMTWTFKVAWSSVLSCCFNNMFFYLVSIPYQQHRFQTKALNCKSKVLRAEQGASESFQCKSGGPCLSLLYLFPLHWPWSRSVGSGTTPSMHVPAHNQYRAAPCVSWTSRGSRAYPSCIPFGPTSIDWPGAW